MTEQLVLEQLAQAKTASAPDVRNPAAYAARIRIELERDLMRQGAAWLAAEASRYGIEAPDLASSAVQAMGRPVECQVCGVCIVPAAVKARVGVNANGWAVTAGCGFGKDAESCGRAVQRAYEVQQRAEILELLGSLA